MILVILGALIALSPFAGLPLSWLDVLTPVLGAGVIAIALTLRGKYATRRRDELPKPE
jgi:hypothetical protein